MVETISLKKVAENFGISENEATKIILDHSNIIVKVLINFGNIDGIRPFFCSLVTGLH